MEARDFLFCNDVWEQKQRERYEETAESRRLLQTARDANTTAPELATVARKALAQLDAQWYPKNGFNLVVEAVAAHPNTPPACFDRLFLRTPVARRAFCRNPIAPFLMLENPNFIYSLHEYGQRELLCETDLPPVFVHLLASSSGPPRPADIQETARLHVAFAGEAQSQAEWEAQAHVLYRKIAREQTDLDVRGWVAELIEIGFLPMWADGGKPLGEPSVYFSQTFGSGQRTAAADDAEAQNSLTSDDLKGSCHLNEWATLPNAPTSRLVDVLKYGSPNSRRLARRHTHAPPDAREISRRAFADRWGAGISDLFEKYDRTEATRQQALLTLASALYSRLEHQDIANRAASQAWTERFEAVWLAPLGDEFLLGCASECTGRDLLDHLSRDPNRMVRGAAKTRLANPAYRFTWQE